MQANENENKECANKVPEKISLFDKAQQAYTNHPLLNFSILTGLRYPKIPRLKGNPFVGRLGYYFNGDDLLQNLLEAGNLASNHPSGMSYYWVANQLVVLLTKPHQIKQVFITDENNVSRRMAALFTEKFWGPNIITDHYDLWKKKRAVYASHFATSNALKEHESHMCATANKYLNKIKDFKNEIKLRPFLSDYNLEIVLNLMLPPGQPRDIAKYREYTDFVGDNVANIKNVFKWSLPIWLQKILFRDKHLSLEQVKKEMKCRFHQLVLDRNEAYIKNSNNILRSIWEIRKSEPGQEDLATNADVLGDGNLLFFAGQDTVTSTFEFIIKLLAANPLIEEKLRKELYSHLRGQEFTMENINQVDYLEMIIKEAMRLFPAPPMIVRGVANNFKIDDVPLFKGSLVIVSPLITHRLESLWENPLKFNPERFSQENSDRVPPHGYIPLGDGRQGCVGWRFGFQELKLLLAAIYLNFHVDIPDNNFEITIKRTTIRPRTPTLARFVPIQ